MTGAAVDAEEDGGGAGLEALQFGGVFEAVGGEDAVVVVAGHDHGGRIGNAGLEGVERTVGAEHGEVGGFIGAAVFLLPGPADGELVEAQHVHDADLRDGAGEEVGALIDHGADQQPAIAATHQGEARGLGPLFPHQKLRGTDAVVEDVLLPVFHAGLVPGLAVFTAAPEIHLGIDAAHFQPREAAGREGGREGDIEPAITVEQHGVVAVLHEAFFVEEEDRHPGAVLAVEEDLADLHTGGIEVELRALMHRALPGAGVVAVDGAGGIESVDGVEGFLVLLLPAEATRGTEVRQGDF